MLRLVLRVYRTKPREIVESAVSALRRTAAVHGPGATRVPLSAGDAQDQESNAARCAMGPEILENLGKLALCTCTLSMTELLAEWLLSLRGAPEGGTRHVGCTALATTHTGTDNEYDVFVYLSRTNNHK